MAEPPKPLTPAELVLVAELIKTGHVVLAIEWYGAGAVSPETLDSLIADGAISREHIDSIDEAGFLGPAYNYGVGLLRTPETEAVAEEPSIPDSELTGWEFEMATAARHRGASLVVGLGNKVADDMTTTVISSDNEQALAYRRAIAEATGAHIEQGKTWRQLQGALGDILDDDWARDLARIAATETQAAVNAGYAIALEKDFGADAIVAVIPNPDACPECVSYYLGPDGKPKTYKLNELPAHTTNYKQKKADKVPVIPPAHPWCHCQLVHVGAGWTFDEDWELMPPGYVAPNQEPSEDVESV